MGWASTEKTALVDTLRRADPEAPTLCAGWDVRRLLAHLVQREQDLPGVVVDGVQGAQPGQEPRLGRLVDAARTPEGTQPWSSASWPARRAGRRSAGPPTRSTWSST